MKTRGKYLGLCLASMLWSFGLWAVPSNPVITVTINPTSGTATPQILALGSLVAFRICAGTQVKLEANSSGSGNITYEWLNAATGAVVGNGASFTTALPEGQYQVRATDANGTTLSTTVVQICVEASPPVQVSIQASAGSVCTSGGGSPVILTALASNSGTSIFCPVPSFQYQWLKDNTPLVGQTNATLSVPAQATSIGTYTVQVSNSCGFGVSSTASITIIGSNAAPNSVSITASEPYFGLCAGGSITLFANVLGVVDSYEWERFGTPGILGTQSSLTVSATGNYRVRVRNGCGITQSIFVNVRPLVAPGSAQIFSLPDPPSACAPDQVLLLPDFASGGNPTRYEWFRDNVSVLVSEYPFDVDVILAATQSGRYKVRLSNACGSTESAELDVQVGQAPTQVSILTNAPPSLAPLCNPPVTQVLLQAITNGFNPSYTWYLNDVPIVGATNASYTATVAGLYRVRASNNCGLMSSAELNVVQVNSGPTNNLSISATETSTCAGSITLQATNVGAGTLYEWQRNGNVIGSTTQPQYVATQSGIYTLIARNACGTSSLSNAITITVNLAPTPPLILAPNGNILCQTTGNIPLQIAAPIRTDVSYQWLRNGQIIAGATQPNFTATQNGSYTVRATNVCGTAISAPIEVGFLRPLTAADVQAVANPCEQPISLRVLTTADARFLQYEWYQITGITTLVGTDASFTPLQSGTYAVRVRNPCLAANTWITPLPITVDLAAGLSLPQPVIVSSPQAGIDRLCPAGQLTLAVQNIAGGSNFGYRWYRNNQLISGANAPTIVINNPGEYVAEIYSTVVANCQQLSAPYRVSLRAEPTLLLGYDGKLTFCVGDSVRLSVSTQVPPLQYRWTRDGSPVGTGEFFFAKSAGKYRVEANYSNATLGFPCNYTAAVEIDLATAPQPAPVIVREGGLLTTTEEATAYQWNFNGVPILAATRPTHMPIDSGRYTLTVINSFGCAGTSNEIYSRGIYVGVNDVLNVIPNPNDGNFYAVVVTEASGLLGLYTITGQTLFSQYIVPKFNSIGGQVQIALHDIAPGMYWLRFETNTGTFVKRVAVVR